MADVKENIDAVMPRKKSTKFKEEPVCNKTRQHDNKKYDDKRDNKDKDADSKDNIKTNDDVAKIEDYEIKNERKFKGRKKKQYTSKNTQIEKVVSCIDISDLLCIFCSGCGGVID